MTILLILFVLTFISLFIIGKLFYNRNNEDFVIVENDVSLDFEIEHLKDESKGKSEESEIIKPKKKRGRKPKVK